MERDGEQPQSPLTAVGALSAFLPSSITAMCASMGDPTMHPSTHTQLPTVECKHGIFMGSLPLRDLLLPMLPSQHGVGSPGLCSTHTRLF